MNQWSAARPPTHLYLLQHFSYGLIERGTPLFSPRPHSTLYAMSSQPAMNTSMNSSTNSSKVKAEKRASSGIPNSKLTQPKFNSVNRTPSPSNQSTRSRSSSESNDASIIKNKSPLATLEPSKRDASPAPTTADKTLEIDISQQVEPPRISKNGRCLSSCPCNQSNPSDWKIDCSSCGQLWHLDCVGLKGLSKAARNAECTARYCTG